MFTLQRFCTTFSEETKFSQSIQNLATRGNIRLLFRISPFPNHFLHTNWVPDISFQVDDVFDRVPIEPWTSSSGSYPAHRIRNFQFLKLRPCSSWSTIFSTKYASTSIPAGTFYSSEFISAGLLELSQPAGTDDWNFVRGVLWCMLGRSIATISIRPW